MSRAKLDALVEEAVIDCYNESEQATGLYTMIEDNLQLPFETDVLGMQVRVIAVDITEDDLIVAVCERDNRRQRLPILELPLPSPRPAGSEWIEPTIIGQEAGKGSGRASPHPITPTQLGNQIQEFGNLHVGVFEFVRSTRPKVVGTGGLPECLESKRSIHRPSE